jgi:hypothetical protein
MQDPVTQEAPMEIKGSVCIHFILFNINLLLPGDPESGRFLFSELNSWDNPPLIKLRCPRYPIPVVPCAPMEVKGSKCGLFFFIAYITFRFFQNLKTWDPGLFRLGPS